MDIIASAEYIKAKVIDYLVANNEEIVLGNEIMYGTKRKKVDLLMLNDALLTAIEIKSSVDSLERLEEQVIEYSKIFNYTIVCCTNKHFSKIHKTIPKGIGLMLFSNDTIELKRKPVLRKKLEKDEILYSIPSYFLRHKLDNKSQYINSDEIRRILSTLSVNRLQAMLYSYYSSKLYDNYKMFQKEIGEQTHIDDIPLLSLTSTKVDIGYFY